MHVTKIHAYRMFNIYNIINITMFHTVAYMCSARVWAHCRREVKWSLTLTWAWSIKKKKCPKPLQQEKLSYTVKYIGLPGSDRLNYLAGAWIKQMLIYMCKSCTAHLSTFYLCLCQILLSCRSSACPVQAQCRTALRNCALHSCDSSSHPSSTPSLHLHHHQPPHPFLSR